MNTDISEKQAEELAGWAMVPVEGWRNVVDNVANNIGEFACAMPTQDMADTLAEYANDLFGLLSAAPNPPSAPVQQSVVEILSELRTSLASSYEQSPEGRAYLAKIDKVLSISPLLSDLIDKQEPLGAEFEKVLYDNLPALYETEPAPLLDKNDQAEGASVSIDISTCDDDADARIFARVIEIITVKGGSNELVILAEPEDAYRITYPNGSQATINRAPDSYELRECKVEELRPALIPTATPQPDSNELVELRRDAERYRWIRNNAGFNLDNDYNIGNFQVSQKIKNGEAWYYYEEKLDEIIDAALAQSPSKKGGE
jgi:hypothetical protein